MLVLQHPCGIILSAGHWASPASVVPLGSFLGPGPVSYHAPYTAASSSSVQAQLTADRDSPGVLQLPWQLVPLPAPGCPSHHHLPHEYQVLTIFVIPQVEKPASQKEPTIPYTVKLRGAPFNVTEVPVWKGRVGRPGSGEVRSCKEPCSGL